MDGSAGHSWHDGEQRCSTAVTICLSGVTHDLDLPFASAMFSFVCGDGMRNAPVDDASPTYDRLFRSRGRSSNLAAMFSRLQILRSLKSHILSLGQTV